MRLHDLLLDELADVRADADTILEHAVVGRRRRRVAYIAGGIAAALALGAGGWAIAGHGTGDRAVDPADNGALVPASARAVAGGLWAAIQDGTLGDVGTPTAWDGLDVSPAGFGTTADWQAPENASDLSTLSLVMVHRDQAALLFTTGDSATRGKFDVSRLCPACERTDLPDGDTLIVATRDSGSSDISAEAVMLDSPRRDLLIYASTRAGSQHGTWPHPTVQELTALVEETTWDWRMPAGLQSAGAGLQHYTERRLDPYAPAPQPSAVGGSASAVASPAAPTPERRRAHR